LRPGRAQGSYNIVIGSQRILYGPGSMDCKKCVNSFLVTFQRLAYPFF